MTDDEEISTLRARIVELETRLAECVNAEEIRELEYRSLVQDVALKADYIARLERAHEEIVVPKDVHIRNLEAMIAQLQDERERGESSSDVSGTSLGRLARKLRG